MQWGMDALNEMMFFEVGDDYPVFLFVEDVSQVKGKADILGGREKKISAIKFVKRLGRCHFLSSFKSFVMDNML